MVMHCLCTFRDGDPGEKNTPTHVISEYMLQYAILQCTCRCSIDVGHVSG